MSKKQTKELTVSLLFFFILMNFVTNMSASVFNGILDQIAVEMNVAVERTGLLSSMVSLGGAIGVPIFLVVFNQYERTKLLKITLVLNIILTIVLTQLYNFDALVILRFFMGLTSNCYAVLSTSTVAMLSPKDKLGKYMAILIMGSALSMVVGVPLTRVVSGFFSWRQIFLVLVGMMLASLVYFIFNLHEGGESEQLNLRQELSYLKQRPVQIMILCTMITFMGYGFQTYLTPYMMDLFPSVEVYMSLILVFAGISNFIGNAIGGVVCDKIGYYKSFILDSLLQMITAILILLTQNSFVPHLALTFLWLANAWFIGLQINTGINVVTNSKSRFMVSLNSSGQQLGSAIGTQITAIIISTLGLHYAILTSIVMSAIVTLILFFNRNNKQVTD